MEDKKHAKHKYALYIFYGLITVLLFLFILSMGDIEEIIQVVKNADFYYLIPAFTSVLFYLALYPLSLCILTRARGCKIKSSLTYNIAMTEHFFNGITPFATGGQPFQVYAFAKAKVKPSESTCLLLMNFLVFMLVTNGYALLAMFYFKQFVTTTAMGIIAVIGFTMNFTVLAITFLLATSKHARALLSKIVELLCKIKLVGKFLEPKKESVNGYFLQVQEAFSALRSKRGAFFLSLLTKALAMGSYYLTTFFILKALGVDLIINDVFFIICGTSFAITTVVFLPTPGSSGGIEFAFKSVFFGISSGIAAVSYGGMLIWRLLTYYAVMLISLAFYLILEFKLRSLSKSTLNNLEENT